MTLLSKYWKELDFEYVTIYSGLRNEEKLFEIETAKKQKIAKLKESLLTARYMQLPKINQQIAELESPTSMIIDNEGNKHSTTEELITLSKNHWLFQKLSYLIYKYKGERNSFSPCPPIYREAFVFYSKEHNIQAIIHICFSCVSIINGEGEILEVSDKFYKKLMEFFNEIIQIKQEQGLNNNNK